MPRFRVTEHDDRGDSGYLFGFVYFSDGRRVAYTSTHGVVSDATGGWGAVTAAHAKAAEDYLNEKCPGWRTAEVHTA